MLPLCCCRWYQYHHATRIPVHNRQKLSGRKLLSAEPVVSVFVYIDYRTLLPLLFSLQTASVFVCYQQAQYSQRV